MSEPVQADHFSYSFIGTADIPDCIQVVLNSFTEFQQTPECVGEWLERRIINNPWQAAFPGIGVGVRDHGRLIGFRAIFAQPWWLNGQSTVIAFAANTSVDANYRGRGLGTELIDQCRHFAAMTSSTSAGVVTQKAYRKLGYVAIGGDGNDFFRLRSSFKASWQKRVGAPAGRIIGSLFDLGLQLRDAKLRRAGFRLTEETRCGDDYDALWSQARGGYLSCLERSSQYLNWRIFDYPTCPLKLMGLRDAGGRLRAYAVWHRQDFGGGVEMAVLRDVFYRLDDGEALPALLYRLYAYWREIGMTWINLEVAAPWLTPVFRDLGYEALPSQGNRYHVFSEPPLPAAVIEGWYRSGLDGDYFDNPL